MRGVHRHAHCGAYADGGCMIDAKQVQARRRALAAIGKLRDAAAADAVDQEGEALRCADEAVAAIWLDDACSSRLRAVQYQQAIDLLTAAPMPAKEGS